MKVFLNLAYDKQGEKIYKQYLGKRLLTLNHKMLQMNGIEVYRVGKVKSNNHLHGFCSPLIHIALGKEGKTTLV